MKQLLFNSLLVLFGISQLNAQDNTIVWQNTIGGSSDDFIDFIDKTTDGGYIVGAYSTSNISGDKTEDAIGTGADYWILKLNENGEIDWQNTIGGTEDDRVRGIAQTPDGGYIVGGISESGISGDKTEASNGGIDYWIIKLDSSGEIVWQNSIGGSGDDFLTVVYQTVDGGYIAGGYSDSNASGDKTEDTIGGEDYWVVKLSATGEIEWENTVGGNLPDFLYDVKQTVDGGYLLGGGSDSFISGDKTENPVGLWDDYWIVKLDNQGVVVWDNTIGGNSVDTLFNIEQTLDGGFLLSGTSYSDAGGDKTEDSLGEFDFWAVKVDNSGVVEWDNTIGGDKNDIAYFGTQLNDGSYILTGHSDSNISGDKTENSFNNSLDYWIVNLAENGSLNWDNTIGANDQEFFDNNLVQTSSGNIVFGGSTNSSATGDMEENSQGGWDLWILEVSGDPSLGINDNELAKKLSVFPNPTNGELTVSGIDISTAKITITNILGDTIKFYDGINTQIDLSDFSSGVYLVTVEVNDLKATKKIIKL